MNRWLIVIMFLLAILAGVFYRLGDTSGIGSFREYALPFLLLIGIIGTFAAHRGQAERGRSEVQRQLQDLPARKLWPRNNHPEHPDLLLIRPYGAIALYLSDLSQSASKSGTIRRLRKEVRRALGSHAYLVELLELPPWRILPMVILTRRKLGVWEGDFWKQEGSYVALTDIQDVREAVELCFGQILKHEQDNEEEADELDVDWLISRLKFGCDESSR